jgi:hypothetical protein
LLELPVTRALTGALSKRMPWLHQIVESRPWRSMHAGGLLARAGLIERITLSPEGSDLAAMCRLTRALLAGGLRVLTLSLHSPSLESGHTPHMRNERDLAIFLDRISGFLRFFRDEIGGEFLTIAETRARLLVRCPPWQRQHHRHDRPWRQASVAWWWPRPSRRCMADRPWCTTAWRALVAAG